MSVSFQGDGYRLDLTNGQASRLLRAMGYTVTEETSGSLSLKKAAKGVTEARTRFHDALFAIRVREIHQTSQPEDLARAVEIGEDIHTLWYLSDLVNDLLAAGSRKLTWW